MVKSGEKNIVEDCKTMHFIGIGGIGMAALAEFLHRRGFLISGSDLMQNAQTRHLESLGIVICYGHDARYLHRNVEAVIYTSAVTEKNPEYQAAKKRALPLLSRGRLLAEVTKIANSIAIAGAHGKTTTTALVAHLLMDAGLDPTYMIGGVLGGQQSPVHYGKGYHFVTEADESDASFLYLSPQVGIVTNIDEDHLMAYGNDYTALKEAFTQFLSALPEEGLAIVNADDPVLLELAKAINCPTLSYGFSEAADVRACSFEQHGLVSRFQVKLKGQNAVHEVALPMPGRHNVQNALAAIALCDHLGVKSQRWKHGLRYFPGVGRRFEMMGKIKVDDGSILVLNDYGHHPNELKVTIQAIEDAWPGRRLVMVFQPHRYTRTRDLMQEFVDVLSGLGVLFLIDVYAAGEQPIANADSNALAQSIGKKTDNPVYWVSQKDDLIKTLQSTLRAKDVLVFQGAGDVVSLAERFVTGCVVI